MSRTLAIVLFLLGAASTAGASSISHFLTFSELVCESDLVAIVRITGADTRFGKKWVYRAEITTAIRGGSEEEIIYFATAPDENYGDSFEYRLGGSYLVALDQSQASVVDPAGFLSPLDQPERGQHYLIGWGPTIVMPVEPRCDFDECVDEVAISHLIDLPEDIPSRAGDEDCRHDLAGATWVQKGEFVSRLLKVSGSCP